MALGSLLPLFAFTFLFACNAYRATPESEISFSRQDLTGKGFILAPIAVPDASLNPGPSELVAYDVILGNTLKEKWKSVNMLASSEFGRTLGAENIESWREDLAGEDVKEPSKSTLQFIKKLSASGRAIPKQVLLPTLLQNSVSCGRKEAVSAYQSSTPHGEKRYCQRIMKMRFRIMSVESPELLWNGLIYATQENAADLNSSGDEDAKGDTKADDDPVAPSTQALIRESFNNFAKQFGER